MSGLIPTEADLAAAGYKQYPERLRDTKSSWQKRFRDKAGTCYFIEVHFWEWDGHRSVSAEAQFSFHDGITFNVNCLACRQIAEMEQFFADVWSRMGCEHYERDDAA